jgi:hypothetical protein
MFGCGILIRSSELSDKTIILCVILNKKYSKYQESTAEHQEHSNIKTSIFAWILSALKIKVLQTFFGT